MSKDSSGKYYQKRKKATKRHVKNIKTCPKKKREKSDNVNVNDI